MTITLSDGTTSVPLDPDLTWSDEHSWSPVAHIAKYKVDGALSIHVSRKKAGRPITLQAGDTYAWMSGAVIEQLRTWRDTPGQQLTLTLRGTSYTVIFRNNEAPALDAEPLVDYANPEADDWYVATIKLMVI
jgi:hypothetical protein